MKTATFPGGVHLTRKIEQAKLLTSNRPIGTAKAPSIVYIPLQQHIGATAKALVKKGDRVKMGQKLGVSESFVSAPVHASVSGEVLGIENYPTAAGNVVLTIIIQNDFQDTPDESVVPGDMNKLSNEQMWHKILDAGIVGMGGAAFPSHVKLAPPKDKKIDALILNGAECEPYLTADHRLMVEHAKDIADGIKILHQILHGVPVYVGIELNKKEAIEKIKEATTHLSYVQVVPLQVKYPQGSEKQIIKTILNREVPSGKLPMDVGVVVHNVATAFAVDDAIENGNPLIRRVVTVSGAGVRQPQNLWVRIGTPFQEVIDQCGGLTEDTVKVLYGGPMMGLAQHDLKIPVVKGTSGILCLTKEEVQEGKEQPCIRCGKCVTVCPMGLYPFFIANAAEYKKFDMAENYHAMDCMECGCCAYVCPSRRYLVQYIRMAKREIAARKRKG